MGAIGLLVLTVFLGVIQTLSATVDADNDKFEPMVAFMCNKPAMYRVQGGWKKDMTTDCLGDKIEILKYCQHLYPDHQITNIVEASYLVSIPNWPTKQGKRHIHQVRPYRCIVGAFQSDALLVPQNCEFDHHHNTSVCQEFKDWNTTASLMCKQRNMSTESFAMLLECGLDRFNGVEFVCCPKGKTSSNKPVPLESSEDSDEDDDDEDDDDDDDDDEEAEKTQAANKPSKDNAYQDYLKGKKGGYRNEHEWFRAAFAAMKRAEQEKITKLMKEWQAAREHVAELRKTDPKSGQTLSHEITERFQRLYKSYEQENLAEKQQIVALHQQHIQGDLNKRKRIAMEKYMNALQERIAKKVLKYLRAYYRAEEKDKMHTVNHYKHVKYTEPKELPRIRPHYREHIKLIDQRLNQSLQMLARYPEILEKVKPEIEKFALRYKSIDASAKNNILNDDDMPEQVNQYDDTSDEEQTEDPETHEDEHSYEREDSFHAHVVNNGIAVADRSEVKEVAISASTQVGSTFGIAIGSVAVFVIIVVAIVMLRRRNHRQPVTHGYVEVDPAASPEERHVANMQMNGYENPTYRYFEMSQPQPQQQ